jgi:DNA polymerase III subunit delta
MNNSRGKKRGTSPDQLRSTIGKGEIYPVYLLYGLEEYGKEAFSHWLVDALAPAQARDFNMDVFRADRFDPLDLLQIYESYPMMAERRLVLLRDCDQLSAEACRSLERVVDAPVDTSCLIFIGGKVDMRRRLFQQLAKAGAAIEFRPPYDREIPQWIQRQAKYKGVKIEPTAVDMLLLYVGNNPRELVGEIDKLVTFVGAGKAITSAAIEEVTAASRQVNVFELAEAVGTRNVAQAQNLLNRYLDQGEEPARAIAMIVRHYNLLLRTQLYMAKGESKEGVAKALGISPFFMGSYMEQARSYGPGSLWSSLSLLRAADWQLRSAGRRQERVLMDMLMVRLCAVGRRLRS